MGQSSILTSGYRFIMRKGWQGFIALALMLLVSSCSFGQQGATPVPQPAVTAPIPTGLEAFYGQQARWTDCGGAQCANIRVPLDYDHPRQGSLSLAVTKVPASGESLGALFVNPGGPGGSGFDYARAATSELSASVTEHYDIIGVDPRGVAKSEPVACLTDAQRDELASTDVSPQTPQELRHLAQVSALPGKGCSQEASPEFTSMGTPSVARDFDIVRAVVADESFNYIGKSYGTAIGTTYAALFPDRVGRMLLDGVLPTDLGLEAITKQQALGFEASLKDFAEDCIGHDDCPFTGNADQIVQGIRSFIEGLGQQSLHVGARQLTGALASSAVLSFLYFPQSDYPRLRSALNDAVKAGNGAPLLGLLDERTGRGSDGHYADNSTDAFYAVTCLDHPYQSTVTRTSDLAKAWAQSSPTFGAGLAWGLLPCSNWPAKSSEQVTTVNNKGQSPILIVNTTHDPATPAVWGAALAKQLGNSRLITRDAYGHTAYHQGSACIDDAVDAYLLQGVLPTANLLCSGNN